jgi:hypothetical protein
LAAAAPERVRSLILNGGWVRSDERFRSLIDSLIAAVERVGSLRALIEVISLWVYPPALRDRGLRTPAVSGGPRSLQRTRARIPPPGPGGPRVDQRMTRTALVLQHQRNAPPALLSDWARQRGVELTVMRADRAPTLPEPDAFAFAITLGSDHSAGHRKPAWVDRELEWLRLADRAALPVLGICFGAQALAVALGGSVEHARQPEIGWISVRRSSPARIWGCSSTRRWPRCGACGQAASAGWRSPGSTWGAC